MATHYISRGDVEPNQPVGLPDFFATAVREVRLDFGSRLWRGCPVDPNPDYDGSDEIEYFFNYVGWGLRGISGPGGGYPPPAYPPV
jgi:hypothetical protein